VLACEGPLPLNLDDASVCPSKNAAEFQVRIDILNEPYTFPVSWSYVCYDCLNNRVDFFANGRNKKNLRATSIRLR